MLYSPVLNSPISIEQAEGMLNLYSNGVVVRGVGMSLAYRHDHVGWSVQCQVNTPHGVRYSTASFRKLIDAAPWIVKQTNWRAREIEESL